MSTSNAVVSLVQPHASVTRASNLIPDAMCAKGAKPLYRALAQAQPDQTARQRATDFLQQQLQQVRQMQPVQPEPDPSNQRAALPGSLATMDAWFAAQRDQTGAAYQTYLAERRAGAPRRYFSTRAHALYFLQVAAPTKLVDGAWLAALLPRWADPDFTTLIRIYLEELGDGVAEKNHVALYRKLITTHGCDQFGELDDSYYVQGAIQLALAHCGADYLPELVGFNLGYEQLPLHLLITAYELNELDIDPYYFTLHVTIDNAITGHAADALAAVRQLAPALGDAGDYWQRVMTGYNLNQLGRPTEALIASYQPEAELIRILQSKCAVGRNLHSDYCRVGGKTINSWLAQPEQIGTMLQELQKAGWFVRGAAPEQSRFWRLLQGDKAEMFGVFSAYEQAVLADWIRAGAPAQAANDAAGDGASAQDSRLRAPPEAAPSAPPQARTMTFRARQRAQGRGEAGALMQRHSPRGLIRIHPANQTGTQIGNPALRLLEQQVAAARSKDDAMALLARLMTPALHHTASGLMATRMFMQLLRE